MPVNRSQRGVVQVGEHVAKGLRSMVQIHPPRPFAVTPSESHRRAEPFPEVRKYAKMKSYQFFRGENHGCKNK